LSDREYELLSAPALRRLIERGVVTAIVPFGSIEHQGGHLPLGSDALLADLVGREVAERLDAVLVPTVRVGCAEQHLERLGTLSESARGCRTDRRSYR
jgi:creatinine amidohydrolase